MNRRCCCCCARGFQPTRRTDELGSSPVCVPKPLGSRSTAPTARFGTSNRSTRRVKAADLRACQSKCATTIENI